MHVLSTECPTKSQQSYSLSTRISGYSAMQLWHANFSVLDEFTSFLSRSLTHNLIFLQSFLSPTSSTFYFAFLSNSLFFCILSQFQSRFFLPFCFKMIMINAAQNVRDLRTCPPSVTHMNTNTHTHKRTHAQDLVL